MLQGSGRLRTLRTLLFWSARFPRFLKLVNERGANFLLNHAPLFKAAKIQSHGHMMSHRLRDTFAVDSLENGVPLEEVSELLGHESIKTTEAHYAKWVKARQDRLDSLVTAVWATKKKH